MRKIFLLVLIAMMAISTTKTEGQEKKSKEQLQAEFGTQFLGFMGRTGLVMKDFETRLSVVHHDGPPLAFRVFVLEQIFADADGALAKAGTDAQKKKLKAIREDWGKKIEPLEKDLSRFETLIEAEPAKGLTFGQRLIRIRIAYLHREDALKAIETGPKKK